MFSFHVVIKSIGKHDKVKHPLVVIDTLIFDENWNDRSLMMCNDLEIERCFPYIYFIEEQASLLVYNYINLIKILFLSLHVLKY